MYAEERQQEIVRLARADGRVDVATLADTLRVTAETIRRDLTTLERAGVLRRVHGGAIPVERIGFEPALATRDSVLIDEKERIAKAALAEVPEEGAIILAAGTTTARLAQALPVDRELTVVVNSPVIATMIGTRPKHQRAAGSAAGAGPDACHRRRLGAAPARRHVRRRRVHRHERSVRGARTHHARSGGGGRQAAMIGSARRAVVLADHTKIGKRLPGPVSAPSPTSIC